MSAKVKCDCGFEFSTEREFPSCPKRKGGCGKTIRTSTHEIPTIPNRKPTKPTESQQEFKKNLLATSTERMIKFTNGTLEQMKKFGKVLPIDVMQQKIFTMFEFKKVIQNLIMHYRKTWFKNMKPTSAGKMLNEWNDLEDLELFLLNLGG